MEQDARVAADEGEAGGVSQAACVAGGSGNSDDSRDQAGDGNV